MGEKRHTCPRRPIKDNPVFFNSVIKEYGFYSSGFLPFDGGTVDQPHRYMELMSYVDKFKSEVNEKRSGENTQNNVQRSKGNPFADQMNVRKE